MRLKNKVAIVTGSTSGIGEATAKKFLEEGAKVVFSGHHSAAKVIPKEHKQSAIFVKCDVSKPKQVDALIKAAVKKFGRLDIMVNNAGIGDSKGILDASDKDWQKVIDVNLSGVFYGIRAAANYMRDKKIKGSIISIASILGEVGFANAISYCAAKGGVVQLTHAGSLDLAPYKIRLNAIAPGFIFTDMTKGILANKKFLKMVKQSTPLGHVGDPEDIANAALYLASDESKYVTGEVLFVDGGWRAQ